MPHIIMGEHWAALVAVLSVARTARLIIHDDFPPMMWLRARIFALYKEDSVWLKLWQCPFCLTPYLAAGMGVWMWLSGLDDVWWYINGAWAASYVAAIIYSYDQPE
jgi:hypothetical protein